MIIDVQTERCQHLLMYVRRLAWLWLAVGRYTWVVVFWSMCYCPSFVVVFVVVVMFDIVILRCLCYWCYTVVVITCSLCYCRYGVVVIFWSLCLCRYIGNRCYRPLLY